MLLNKKSLPNEVETLLEPFLLLHNPKDSTSNRVTFFTSQRFVSNLPLLEGRAGISCEP
jgi:hypothetical protein